MKENQIIFKAIIGSFSYGTYIEGRSDFDHKGVYAQDIDELVSFGYKEQVEVNKDECYFEVRRFIELLRSANPTVLELLYSPKDCIVQTSPEFDIIVQNRDKFLTKKCLDSFGGYAMQQIRKAKGLDKKMNWEKKRVERKTPIDFVYICVGGKTMPVKRWLEKENKTQERCGLVALDHMRDCFALYYDDESHTAGFKGIMLDDSNAVRLSSVPKDAHMLGVVSYNSSGYTTHCKDYKDYITWLENRNTERYVDIKGHNQQIDGKNLLHCRRLLDMAMEIATLKTINVRRPNAEYLLSIRKGEVELDEIIAQAEKDLKNLDELFANSDLPDDCDDEFVNGLLLSIREITLNRYISNL